MTDLKYATIPEIQTELGKRLKAMRISMGYDQVTLAAIANITDRSLRNLESGRGCSLDTFLRILKAMQSLDWINQMAPEIDVSPMEELLKQKKTRQRVRVAKS